MDVQNYKNNAAYDFDLFEIDRSSTAIAPKKVQTAVIEKLPVKKAPKSIRTTVTRVSVAAIILFMVCFNIYTRVEINETANAITKADKQLEVLNSERVRLEVQMKNEISYKNIEEEAKKLGMQKKEKAQIHYIRITGGDKAEVLDTGLRVAKKDEE